MCAHPAKSDKCRKTNLAALLPGALNSSNEDAVLAKVRRDLARRGLCVGGVATVHSCFATCFSVVSQPGRFLGHEVSLLRCVCWWPYLRSDCPIKPLPLFVLVSRGVGCQLPAESTGSRLGRRGPLARLAGLHWHGCPSLYVSKSRTHRERVSLFLLQGHLPD